MAKFTRYRDLANPASPQIGIGGGGDVAASLSRTFDEFGQRVQQVALGLASQAGAVAGAREGAAGQPKPKNSFGGLTAYGRAYNSAAEAAYFSKIETDIAAKADELQRANEAEPTQFDVLAGAYSTGVLESVVPEYKDRVSNLMNRAFLQVRSNLLDQRVARDREDNLAAVQESIPFSITDFVKHSLTLPSQEGDAVMLAGRADLHARIDGLVNEKVIGSVKALDLKESIDKGIAQEYLDQRSEPFLNKMVAAMRANTEVGDAMASNFMANPAIPEDVKARVWESYDKQRTALHSERSRTFGESSAGFAADIAHGQYGPAMIARARRLFQLGASSVDEFQGFMSAIANNEDKAMEDGVDISRVTDIMKLEDPLLGLDPKNEKDRKAVGVYFDALTVQAGLHPGDERWQAAATAVATKTNIMPAAADRWARINALSPDPNKAAQASAFIKRVSTNNSPAWDYNRDPKLDAYAREVNDGIASGVSPAEAVTVAKQLVYDVSDKQIENLHYQYRKGIKDDPNSSSLNTLLKHDERTAEFGFFSNSLRAPIPQDMQYEYDRLVARYYDYSGGDIEKARSRANDAILSQWGVTKMNGTPQMVKFPPEKFYGVNQTMIDTDKAAVLKAVNYTGDPAKTYLAPLPQETERSNGRTWALMTTDEYGNPEPVRKSNNMPMFYQLPLSAEARRAAAEADKQRLLTEARAKREAAKRMDKLATQQLMLVPGLGPAIQAQ